MAIGWMVEAARLIAIEYRHVSPHWLGDSIASIAATIERCCPLQPDVAYMPVPRCEACNWWSARSDAQDRHYCLRLVDSSGLTHGSKAVATYGNAGLFGDFRTEASFGCVQWEAKP